MMDLALRQCIQLVNNDQTQSKDSFGRFYHFIDTYRTA